MLICKSCGAVFDEFELKRVVLNESEYCGQTVREYGAVCPVCGGNHYEEAHECDACGMYSTEDQLYDLNGYSFCEDCLQKELRIHSDAVTRFFVDNRDYLELLDDYFKENEK